MNVTKILSIGFLLASVGLGIYLVNSIKSTMDERALISEKEALIIEKLQFIREAEIVYLEVNGNYTSDWDKLISFVESGEYPIIQKKERIVTLSYGADSSIVTYDTLDIIPAKDRIFKTTYNVNSANDGTIVSYEVSSGDMGVQGSPAYTLNQNGRKVTHKFKESGIVKLYDDFTVGSVVSNGDLLMSVTETKFDLNIDVSRIAYVPGYEDVKFNIFAAEIERSNLIVDVIEVANPKPIDPNRKEDSETKNKRPLRFGSKTDVTTSGNWE